MTPHTNSKLSKFISSSSYTEIYGFWKYAKVYQQIDEMYKLIPPPEEINFDFHFEKFHHIHINELFYQNKV